MKLNMIVMIFTFLVLSQVIAHEDKEKEETIRVLLLGGAGSGKTTFINTAG